MLSILLLSVNGQTSILKLEILKSASSPEANTSIVIKKNSYEEILESSDSIYKDYLEKGFFSSNRSNIRVVDSNVFAQRIYLEKRFYSIYLEESNKDADEMVVSQLSRKRKHFNSLEQFKQYLNLEQKLLQDEGYPFAKVSLEKLDLLSKTDTAVAFINVNKNEARTLNRIIVKGYPGYPKGLTKKMLRKTTAYNPKSINRILNVVENTPYIKTTRQPEALFKKDSTLLYLYLERVKSNQADGLIAFNNNDEDRLELTGYLQANLLNNFNLGESIAFEYRNADGDQSILDLAATVPYVLLSSIGIDGRLNITRRDSTYQNSTISIGAKYPIAPQINIGLSYLNKTSNATTPIAGENRNEDFNVNGVSLSSNYVRPRNNLLQPINLNATITATIQTRDGELVKDDQLMIHGEINKVSKLSPRLFIMNRLNGFYLETDNLQFNELTQIGGQQSIRGFNVNSIDTSAFLSTQSELRYVLNDQIYLHTIADAGVFNEFTSRNSQYLYSIGAGLAILTKAGVLRISASNGRFVDAKDAVSSTIADINLLVRF
ncbi:BamA/TamA family outer membrane protein [Nonlabens ponticola]|nr:BamA/TamA family outer membrane protein [Nonlabens ponticola]